MNSKFSSLSLVVAMTIGCLGLTACKREAPTNGSTSTSVTNEGTAVLADAPALAPGSVVVEEQASDDRMQVSNSGEKSDGKVRATGVSGALIFGPYMPLAPGKYSLLVEGSSSGPFVVDVVHSAGSKQIAKQEYPAQSGNATGSGSLAVLDFEVVEPIENAEFRVIVPENANTTVVSYKVVAK